MDTRIYPCGCPIKPGQAECEIKEPHATIADFNLGETPGPAGPLGEYKNFQHDRPIRCEMCGRYSKDEICPFCAETGEEPI